MGARRTAGPEPVVLGVMSPFDAGLAAAAGRCGKAGRSAVFVGAGAIGVVLETVGRSGDGDPPLLAGPVLGAARPDPAGGTNGGAAPAPGAAPDGGTRCPAPAAGGAVCGGRCAGTPSGAVGTAAGAGGTNGRGGPLAGPPLGLAAG